MKKQCTDHLGNVFESKIEMCKYWNVTRTAYKNRIKYGWSQEKALTTPVSEKSHKCVDHLGNTFNSEKEMCKYWGITKGCYRWRAKKSKNSKTVEKILTDELKNQTKFTDHLGNVFSTQREMCEHWNIHPSTYRKNLRAGLSIEQSLTTKLTHECVDHNGKKFKSEKDLCDYYDITVTTYIRKKKQNIPLKDILTHPKGKNACKPIWFNGKCYKTLRELATAYNVSYTKLKHRLENDWPIEQALELEERPKYRSISCKDHLNNTFPSISKMLQYWHVGQTSYEATYEKTQNICEALTRNNFKPNDNIGKYNVITCLSNLYYLVKTNDSEEFVIHLYTLLDEYHKQIT